MKNKKKLITSCYFFQRENDVDEALSKQPKQIEAYFQRLTKKEEQEHKKNEKQEQILNMARDHFGYDIDLRDPR